MALSAQPRREALRSPTPRQTARLTHLRTHRQSLGIDYNIFQVTRVREETLLHGTRRGALTGLSATAGVITSAGLVSAGTFAATASLPLVFAAELGFAVAFGVLLDTMIVRSVLVTALTLDVGRWMWWPGELFGHHDDLQPPAGKPDLEPSPVRPPGAAAPRPLLRP
jgi:RND superfamily putative drug exporter